MKKGYRILKDAIYKYPLVIPSMGTKFTNIANSYLPYSTGIEIECSMSDNYSINFFKQLGLIDVKVDSTEQRYRFNTGTKGLIEIYKTCELLNQMSELNISSGIHYHIDLTDCFLSVYEVFNLNNKCFNWVLDELDSWNYTGKYNARKVSFNKDQVRLHTSYKTIEIRIGEMTFDYELMIKRILHCQSIAKKIRKQISNT